VDRIASCVEECGYAGLEIRGLEDEMLLPSHAALAPGARAAFRERFASLGCQVACLGSSAHLTAPPGAAREKHLDEARAFVELAAGLDCGIVRLFAGRIYEGDSRETSGARMAEALAELEPVARAAEVSLAVETHDDWCCAADLGPVIRGVGSPFVGILWDINHPYRHGEAPEVTAREVRDVLTHVHTKDGLEGGGYTLFGEGDLPLREMLSLIHAMGYDEHLSLEWEKKWHPDIEEPEVALPHYATTLADMLRELGIPEG
jgi:sugar phosphate isomerase/epimerase